MTTTTTALPTDKEAFFRDYLVPAGQLAEILIAALPHQPVTANGMRLSRSRGANALFNTLHRASLYAITPANGDLRPLGEALVPLMAAMRDTLRSRSTASLAKALNSHAFRGLVADTMLASFFQRLPGMAQAIDLAIGYPDKHRKDWLAAQSASLTALTCDGRPGRWRTLVRNTSWDACLALLDIGPLQLRTNRFSSRVGVEKAPQLWRDAFPPHRSSSAKLAPPPLGAATPAALAPVAAVTALPEAASQHAAGVAESAPAPASSRLPAGVSVSSTPDGRLRVAASFDPGQMLGRPQQAALRLAGVKPSAELSAALAMREFVRTCDLDELLAATCAAQDWQQEQRGTRAQLMALFDAWQHAVRVKTVQDKLKANFNAEERRILATLLAAEYPAIAAISAAVPAPASPLPETPTS